MSERVGLRMPSGKANPDECYMHADGFHYFIPGVVDPDDLEGLLGVIPAGSPVAVALTGGGAVLLGQHFCPILGKGLRGIQVLPAYRLYKNQVVTGVAMRLPDYLARFQTAWDALRRQVPYDLQSLMLRAAEDLASEVGRIVESRVMRDLLDGLQAQASTDIRLPRNTIGMSPRTAEIFHRRLSQVSEEVAKLQSVEGMLILAQRYPAANKKSARWAKIVILPDVPDFQLLYNPEDWNDLNGGDTDGDLGYGGSDGVARLGKRLQVGPYPHLVRYGEEHSTGILGRLAQGWAPISQATAVERVMGMCIKELTGLLDYTFHNLARAYAVESRRCEVSGEWRVRVRRFREAYLTVFGVYFPIQEKVMDARKLEGGLDSLYRLARCLQDVVAGKAIDAEAFFPFLSPEDQETFRDILYRINHNLGGVRGTAYGRLVASGRKRKENILPLLDLLGDLRPEEILTALQEDALGHQLLTLKPRKRSRKKGKQPATPKALPTVRINPEVQPRPGVPGDSLLNLFRSIEVDGRPVFSQVSFAPDGDEPAAYRPYSWNKVTAWVDPTWLGTKGTRARWKAVLTFPAIFAVGTEGHALVEFPGMPPRFFRPRFHLADGEAAKSGLGTLLKESLVRAVERLIRYGDRQGRKTQHLLEQGLREAVLGKTGVKFQGDNPDDQQDQPGLLPSNPLLDLIHQFEYEVVTPEGKTLVERWEKRQLLLSRLAAQGLDVLSTSKGRPGTVVTRANGFGIPDYLHAINPFAVYLDGKRRVEPREIRRALPLAHPEPLPVQALGTAVPAGLQDCLTLLNVCVLDCNANVFTREDGSRFCHDTLLGTWEGVAKLAIARLEFTAVDRMGLDRLIERLNDLNLSDRVSMECTEEKHDLGDGLQVGSWRVILSGHLEDVGKIKATVGPIKGVLTVLPVRIVARHLLPSGEIRETPIHLVVPQDTIERKKALDAVLFMLADKAGMTVVDPAQPLGELCTEIETRLAGQGEDRDGREEIIVIHPDGTEDNLGMALVGRLPFYRPPQTGLGQFAARTGQDGMTVHSHALVMAGLAHNTPRGVQRDFLEIQAVRERLLWLSHQDFAAVKSDAGTEVLVEGQAADFDTVPDQDELPEGWDHLEVPALDELLDEVVDLGDMDLGFGL